MELAVFLCLENAMLHPNDKRNLRKHRKMERRQQKGRINPSCKWAKKRA